MGNSNNILYFQHILDVTFNFFLIVQLLLYGGPQVSRQNFLIHGKTLNFLDKTLLFRAKF